MTTTPADTLRAAAQRLRALATDAAEDSGSARWRATRQFPTQPDATHTFLSTATKLPLLRGGGGRGLSPAHVHAPVGDYIATMDPAVGLALADWLDAAAEDAATIEPHPTAGATARAILGTEPHGPAAHATRPQDATGDARAVPGMPEAESGAQAGADGFGLRESVQQVLAELRTRLVAQHKGAMAASAASSGDAALIHDGSRMGIDVAVAELDALALRLAEGRSGAPDRS